MIVKYFSRALKEASGDEADAKKIPELNQILKERLNGVETDCFPRQETGPVSCFVC
jgi:hypothetical protein